MKIINKKWSVIIILILTFNSISGQTKSEIEKIKAETNVAKLKELSKQFKQEAIREQQQISKLYKGKLKKNLNGKEIEIVGLTQDLKPLYDKDDNTGSGVTSRVNALYTGGSLGLNVNGESMIAAMWELKTARLTHEIFENRAQNMNGSTVIGDHATHVGGTIIGTDQVLSGRVRGMAYKGNLHCYKTSNLSESEMATAAANGLLLSNHSYGYDETQLSEFHWGKYIVRPRRWDQVMYNAPYYQIVKSGGNTRDKFNIAQVTAKNGYDLMKGGGVAKNVLVVAAVNEVPNYTGPSSVVMSTFSNWGPTDDGRIKPDLSAKGVSVKSSISTSNSTYYTDSGTSMAAPSVTGTLLLLQQHYKNLKPNYMKSASLRALTIHTADEAGDTPGPDYEFGWGLINAEKAAQIISNEGVDALIKEETLTNSNQYTITVTPTGTEPLVVTIAWTDPTYLVSSNTVVDYTTPVLVNDLDVRVSNGASQFLPWRLNGISNPSAAAIQSDNSVDNIEKIEIPNPIAGQSYTITVSHKGSLQNSSQDFSLVVSGIDALACPQNLMISTNVNSSSTDNKQAEFTITATNTINNNATAVYHAGEEVLLTSSFDALNGSEFRGYIEGCTGNYVRSPGASKEVITYNNRANEYIITEENKSESDSGFSIYPNPTTGEFNVKVKKSNSKTYNIEIYSLQGMMIYTNKVNSNIGTLKINGSSFKNGMYLIKISSKDELFTSKIIKK